MRGSERRADIQGLRAIAVLLIVAFHAGLPVPGGFIGVDVFFVISGFVIAQVLLRQLERTNSVDFASFYTRRIRRLLPALALLIVVVAVASVLLLSPIGPQQATARTGLAAALLSANIQLGLVADGGYFALASEANALLHTWSLSVEEQFYLVFPALLVAAWRFGMRSGRWSPRRTAFAVVMVAVATSFALSYFTSYASYGSRLRNAFMGERFAFYSSVARGWEFGVGVLLALVVPALSRLGARVGGVLWIAGVVFLGVGAFTITAATPFPGIAALWPVLGAAAILAAGTAARGGVIAVLGVRPAVWVGDVSYGWYLWHWPIIVFATALWPGNRWVPILAALGSLVPTWLSYRFIENPIRFNDRLTGRRVLPLVIVCLALPLAAILGLRFAHRLETRNNSVATLLASTRIPGDTLEVCSASELGSGTVTYCGGSATSQRGTIVLVGDSNAHQFTEPVNEASKALGYRFMVATIGGCPFVNLVGAVAPPARFDGEVCLRFVRESVAAMRNAPPALAIVATSSSQVLSEFGGFALTDPISGEVASTPDAKARLFERGLASVLEQLAEARIPTLVVHPIPHFGELHEDWQAAACPAVRIFTNSCGTSIDRARVERQQQLAREAEKRAVARVPGAAAVDFTDDLCAATVCNTHRDGLLLYRDATHLSVGGALTLTGRFRELINGHAATRR